MTNHLDACGWSSFDARLFVREPGRVERDVSEPILKLLGDQSPGPRLLELFCGAGSLCIQLARSGYDVSGIDLSSDMLRQFREQAAAEAPDVLGRLHIVQADVCSFDLGQTFDFILIEDDSFVYLHSHQDQIACLSRAREHMGEASRLFLRFTTPQRELLADEEYKYDEIQQIKTVSCRWTKIDANGEERRIDQGVQRRRLTWPCELELLLQTAGLHVLERWGDLDRTPLTDPTYQEYCYLIEKAR